MGLSKDQIEALEREAELEIEAVLDWEQEMQATAADRPCVGFRGDDERDLEDTEESP